MFAQQIDPVQEQQGTFRLGSHYELTHHGSIFFGCYRQPGVIAHEFQEAILFPTKAFYGPKKLGKNNLKKFFKHLSQAWGNCTK